MANAKRDQNSIPTMLGLLNSDGVTGTLVYGSPTTHGLDVDDNTTGSDNGGEQAKMDDNGVTPLIVVSEVDGVTPVALYVNSSNQLLIDSN